MYTKYTNTVPAKKQARAEEIRDLILQKHQEKPIDIVVTSDDDAFGYFVPLVLHQFPIVFQGIAKFPSVYNQTFHFYDSLDKPGHNITGIFKRANFVSTLETFEIMLGLYSGKTIMILFDDTITGRSCHAQYVAELVEKQYILDSMNIATESHIIRNMEDYQEYVEIVNNNDMYSGIFHFIFSLYSRSNTTNYETPQIYAWAKENNKKPTISYIANFCSQGLGYGFDYSLSGVGFEWGLKTGKILRGLDINTIPINMDPKKEMFFNLDVINQLGMKIDQFFLDEATFLFQSPDYTLIVLAILLPLLSVTSFFIIITVVIVSVGTFCVHKTKKELEWTSAVAESISNLDLDHNLILTLEKKPEKKRGKVGRVFMKIVGKLRQFKPYLPTTLFVPEGVDEDEDENDTDSVTYSDYSSSNQSSRSSINSVASSIASEILKDRSTKSSAISKKINKLGLYFEKKEISLLVCSIDDIKNLITSSTSNDQLLEICNSFIKIVSSCTESMNGSLNFVKGQNIICSWNSIRKQKSTHAAKACETGLKILCLFKTQSKNWINSGIIRNEIKLFMSVFTDFTFCGNVGTKTIRKFNIFGGIDIDARELLQRNEEFGSSMLINSKCYEKVKYEFDVMAVGIAKQKEANEDKSNPRKNIIYEVINKKTVASKDEEWMYAYSKIESNDPFKQYNQAFHLFFEKKYTEAKESLDMFVQIDGMENNERALALMEKIKEKM